MAKPWRTAAIPSQASKRFLITGGNSGVGFAAAQALVAHGATVVLACRDAGRATEAAQRLGGHAEVAALDLASLASVRALVAAETAGGRPLHGLINNAGVFCPPRRQETEDGLELQFGTNVLGHYALTLGLLPLLEQTGHAGEPGRVVTLASIAHKRGRLHFEDLQFSRRYVAIDAYAQSKLADLMFALALERRLRAAGRRTLSLAVHPGVAATNLFKIGNSRGLARGLEQLVARSIGVLLNDDAQGALPTLYAATAPEAAGGGYYGPQGFAEMRGGDTGAAKIAPQALDEAAQDRLWAVCAELSGAAPTL